MDGDDLTHDLPRLLEVAERAARTGGDVIRSRYGRARGVESKAPGDYVSEADHSSEEAIAAALAQGAPGIPFFGEEGGGVLEARGWIVDPLDGTANFLHGFPVVGVSVALVDDHRPVVGVVHAPFLGETYTAVAGGGAACNGEPVRVSGRPAAEAICATGFPFKAKERIEAYVAAFRAGLERFEDLRRAGAASLDLAWTGAGVFDGFFELGLKPWDVAAGGLVIREAGGVVTDWEGDDGRWLATGDVLAGPPRVHEVLMELAEAARSAARDEGTLDEAARGGGPPGS